MAIDAKELARHVADYNQTCPERKTDKFVCPITLRECDPHELMNGHVLPEGIVRASRRTVIQYSGVDHFYGSRVEASLVRYLNLTESTKEEIVQNAQEITVRFSDGEEIEAFIVKGVAAEHAAKRYPMLPLHHDGRPFMSVFVKTTMDDPRLTESKVELIAADKWMPSQWVGSMLKAGFLTKFDMLGYGAVFNPFSDTLRRTLAAYYNEGGKPKDAGRYFAGYRNAVKVVGRPDTGSATNFVPFECDSIEDRQFFLHHTPARTMFAMTFVFKVNAGTVMVTVPQSTVGADVAVAVEFYDRLMRGEESLPQWVIRVKFENGVYRQKETLNFRYYEHPKDIQV